MSKVKWTAEQQKVIDLRDCSILVSAAAGSGKTAVLVERIIQKITDPRQPVDLDRLLVVTFTRAAAAQMKERIGTALEERLLQDPENSWLQRQEALLPNAMITTIDSFCLRVVQDHFHEIDLDPSFRVSDETELELLRHDVLEDLLEEKYGGEEEDFQCFAACYGGMKSDLAVEEMTMSLYRMALSYPWPEEWLDQTIQIFQAGGVEEMEQSSWMKLLECRLREQIGDLLSFCKSAAAAAAEEDGPGAYLDVLLEDQRMLEELWECRSYRELSEKMTGVSRRFQRLPAVRKPENPEKKELVKSMRDEIKSLLTRMEKDYFSQTPEQIFQDMQSLRQPMEGLAALTKEFMKRFARAKEERRVVDFGDLEHFALRILADHEKGDIPTPVAREYREQFQEIYIDEYQDSNYVQETILNSISGESLGKPNLFMVGDVKQSIYKFRLARPELFMEKYRTFSLKEGDHRRIDLRHNFRSRLGSVLEPVNFLFRQLMMERLGGVEYNEENALYQGGAFPETEHPVSDCCELLLIREDEETEEISGRELQARAIAARIRELTDPETGMYIRDGEEYRLVRPGDIAVLLRTMAGWADIYADVLQQEGIPAYAETQRGYFESPEIRTVLALLQVIDNPRQDIPLAAVLRSAVCGLTEGELAEIRSITPDGDFYGAFCAYRETGSRRTLREKLLAFWQMLDRLRSRAPYLPTCQLIEEALELTGYGEYAAALPGGEKRRANLDMLLQKAIDYEQTGYRGLFQFIRYMERMQQYDIDYGDASADGENKDSVVIMSIHKSKGLEFPVVFVGALEKRFNHMDASGRLIIHPDYGACPDYLNPETRRRTPTLLKKVMQQDMILSDLGEELRVLYVALTRAKEKLILVGSGLPGKKIMAARGIVGEKKDGFLPYLLLSRCSSYLDWISLALMRHPGFRTLAEELGTEPAGSFLKEAPNVPVTVRVVPAGELLQDSLEQQLEVNRKKEALRRLREELAGSPAEEPGLRQFIQDRLCYRYPYAGESTIPVKFSVSELKKAGKRVAEEEEGVVLFEPPVPRFMETGPKPAPEEDALTGARLGTVYHKIMECLEWRKGILREEAEQMLEELVRKGRITEEELAAADTGKIWQFLSGSLAGRMANGTLKKEQPFVMGVEAREVIPDTDSRELVLIQGIIDAFFREEDGLVVVDYKTDRVSSPDGAEVLKQRYRRQLELYARALSQITGYPVKECYLYSFALGDTILL